MKNYLIGYQNIDKSIDITKITISDSPEALKNLMEKVNELRTLNEILDYFNLYDRVADRNTLIEELQNSENSGLFVYIHDFWVFSDGENLLPLDEILET